MTQVKNIYKNVIFVFFISLVYSVLRYNIIKGIEWIHLPLYVSNKAISLSAVILMALSVIAGRKAANSEEHKILAMRYGWIGFQFIVVHVFISFTLLSEVYFGKFYQAGSLNLTGELSLLFGILAFILLLIYSINAALQRWGVEPFHPGISNSLLRSTAIILIAGHLLVMGFKGWLNVPGWPGNMFPISLIAFIIVLIIILIGFIRIKK